MLLDNAPSGGGLRMKVSGNYTESGIGELQGFLRTDCEMLLCFFCVARNITVKRDCLLNLFWNCAILSDEEDNCL
jgi:hypothetical protein